MQFAVVPLLVEGQSVGVVVIGTPLVDAVVGFKKHFRRRYRVARQG